jgi:hypothetical protein
LPEESAEAAVTVDEVDLEDPVAIAAGAIGSAHRRITPWSDVALSSASRSACTRSRSVVVVILQRYDFDKAVRATCGRTTDSTSHPHRGHVRKPMHGNRYRGTYRVCV